MSIPRSTTLLLAASAGFVLLQERPAHAQWWKRAPVDFEECADQAEKSATKQEKTAALAECNAKFAGRRKPGGGYTYYDFLQDRTFDIAGPNPTPDEQKRIDESYTTYLANQRRNTVAAETAARQEQQKERIQQASLRSEPERVPAVPMPAGRPKQQPQPVQGDARAKPKSATPCVKGSFSCEWPRLSEGLNDLKKLFTTSPNKARKG